VPDGWLVEVVDSTPPAATTVPMPRTEVSVVVAPLVGWADGGPAPDAVLAAPGGAAKDPGLAGAAPEVAGVAAPEVGAVAAPEVGDTAAPDVGDTAVPEVGDTAVPDVGDTAVPDVGDTAVPDVGDTAVPDVGDTAVPDVGDTMPIPDPGLVAAPLVPMPVELDTGAPPPESVAFGI